jgi:hypothetical protein
MRSNINKSVFLFLITACGCTKLVQIPPPTSTITTSQVFADSADAEAAISGIYTTFAFANGGGGIGNGYLTMYLGESADELLPFGLGDDDVTLSTNTVLASNYNTTNIWDMSYSNLYQPNAIIDGLQASSTLSKSVKDEFMGEAKWFRAFINLYLVNLFGDIPLVTSIDYKSNSMAPRTPVLQVYQSIVGDLKNAQNMLPTDYSSGGGERIRVNQWAATALLARAYLYIDSFANAEAQASAVINNNSMFNIVSDPNAVFLKNSSEAILQWQNNSALNGATDNATFEGYNIIPYDSTSQPGWFYLSSPLLNSFESGDLRKTAWIDSTDYNGVFYYYPYKYKVGPAQTSPNSSVTEYYTVLRLAEQYLIRSEARAQQNKLPEAISDLNVLRTRAGLANLSPTLNQTQILAAVAQERRVELFAEWGHRWLDLKRTGQVGAVFNGINYKAAYQPFQQLYPIPPYELQTDPNLKQNPGY